MRDNNARVPAYMRDHVPHVDSVAARGQGAVGNEEEASCPAFGFLRGLDARALFLELRLRGGNSEWFAYSCLVSWRHNPSVGLLLKFSSGDGVTLVLVQGSNVDAPVGEAKINLTDRGLQRQRIVYICEMDEDELQRAKGGQPSIDSIDIAEFETVEEQREWLKARAPVFLRKQV